MKLVFLAGPYRDFRGPHYIRENIERARGVAVELWQMGYAVLCPHLNTAMMDGACPDEVWLAGALEMMRRCDLVIMLPGWEASIGATTERVAAFRRGIPRFDWADDKRASLVLLHPPA